MECIPTIQVKVGETTTQKDIFSNIFSNPTNYAMDEDEWAKTNTRRQNSRQTGIQGGPAAKPIGTRPNQEVKKFWISSATDSSDVDNINTKKAGKKTPDLMLLGNAIVLTPAILNPTKADVYPSQLNKSDFFYDINCQGLDGKPKLAYPQDGQYRCFSPTRTGDWSKLLAVAEPVRRINQSSELRVYTHTTNDNSKRPNRTGLAQKYTPNIWSTADVSENPGGQDSAFPIQQFFSEIGATGFISHDTFSRCTDDLAQYQGTNANSPNKIYPISSIISKFYLKKNQPLSISFDLTKISTSKNKSYLDKSVIVNTTGTAEASLGATLQKNLTLLNGTEMSAIFDDDKLDGNILVIVWGEYNKNAGTSQYALAFHHKTQTWTLYKLVEGNPPTFNGSGQPQSTTNTSKIAYTYSAIGMPQSIPSIRNGGKFQLMIYPLGNQLIVSNGSPNQYNDKDKKELAVFNLGEDSIIGEGRIKIYFYGDHGTTFKFLPVYHRPAGECVSNVKNLDIVSAESADIFANLDYAGKVGLERPAGSTQSWVQFSFPNSNDTEKLYDYLENSLIQLKDYNPETANDNIIGGQFYDSNRKTKRCYRFKLISNENYGTTKRTSYQNTNSATVTDQDAEDLNRLFRQFSPIVYTAELNTIPLPKEVNLISNGDVELKYVKNISISQTVESYSGSVTLYNRQMDPTKREGLYTNDYRIKGVKPIKISARIKTNEDGIAGASNLTNEGADETSGSWQRLFTGFITDHKYSRAGADANSSVVNLTLEDASIRAKDVFAVNLPIFDGFCHLAVIYWLARYAGYNDDEIMLWQNPLKEDDKIRLVDALEGDGLNFRGECFNGHVRGFPRGDFSRPGGSQNIAGENLHACLPLGGFFDQPNYMFQMGTPIWDCMMEVAEFSGFFLFANNWGSICYTPGEYAVSSQTNYEFVEQPGDPTQLSETAFNEVRRNLEVNHPTSEIRNAVISQGLMVAGSSLEICPIVMVQRQDGWPDNVTDPTYIPWLRFAIQRNPHWGDPSRLKWNNDQLFYRISRQRNFANWSAWGRGLYPYQTFQVNETHLQETGVNGLKYIASAVTHTLNADQFTWEVSIEAEKFEDEYKYSPHVA